MEFFCQKHGLPLVLIGHGLRICKACGHEAAMRQPDNVMKALTDLVNAAPPCYLVPLDEFLADAPER